MTARMQSQNGVDAILHYRMVISIRSGPLETAGIYRDNGPSPNTLLTYFFRFLNSCKYFHTNTFIIGTFNMDFFMDIRSKYVKGHKNHKKALKITRIISKATKPV